VLNANEFLRQRLSLLSAAISFGAFGRDLCGQTVAIVAAFWLRMISANFMHRTRFRTEIEMLFTRNVFVNNVPIKLRPG